MISHKIKTKEIRVNYNKQVRTGIIFWGLLGAVFITLKLCDLIAWSWWWVLSPIWIPISGCLFALTFLGVLFGIAKIRR